MSVLGGLPKKCYFYVALVFVAHNLDQMQGKKNMGLRCMRNRPLVALKSL